MSDDVKAVKRYTVTGTAPVKVDDVWRPPGASFSTATDVAYLVNIGALTEDGTLMMGAEVVPARDVLIPRGKLEGE